MRYINKLLSICAAITFLTLIVMAPSKAQTSDVVEITDVTLASVLDAPVPADKSLTFVLVCQKTSADCVNQLQDLRMTAAKAHGGWLGPDLSTAKFYFIGATKTTMKALGDQCDTATHVLSGAVLCGAMWSPVHAKFFAINPVAGKSEGKWLPKDLTGLTRSMATKIQGTGKP